ncbi:MAG TPA: glycine cleavage system protein GcvH [Phycisphaerales bacterium]|nr:glycine cleavage system protein GcvH [Phycisphaerales bacterium]HCD30873.1 glycine cleavage system protein GcvH [Phycisphaerales bacterium]|tara:strand:- start:89551 stop:89925 length:375 start_codon:yes stop_codon:yes gene_type:complete
MASKTDRTYLESHEWHKVEGDLVVIGISQHAVDELSDITFIEYGKESGTLSAGDTFGEIESVKATSELYCGIDGEVVEVNNELIDSPQTVNDDPWDKGWMIKVKPSNPDQVKSLLSAEDYDAKS